MPKLVLTFFIILSFSAFAGAPDEVLDRVLLEQFVRISTPREKQIALNKTREQGADSMIIAGTLLAVISGGVAASGSKVLSPPALRRWTMGSTFGVAAVYVGKDMNDGMPHASYHNTHEQSLKQEEIFKFRNSEIYQRLVTILGDQWKVEAMIRDASTGWRPLELIRKYIGQELQGPFLSGFADERKEMELEVPYLKPLLANHSEVSKLVDNLALERVFFKMITENKSAAVKAEIKTALEWRTRETLFRARRLTASLDELSALHPPKSKEGHR